MVPAQVLCRWRAWLFRAAVLVAAVLGGSQAWAQGTSGTGAGFAGTGTYLPQPGAAMPPPAADPAYRAYAIVTGTDLRQRPWGFAQCLRAVLVKVSGEPRLRGDPRVAALADHADRFVAHFFYADMMAGIPLHDDQGTYDRPHRLTVDFDPARIDAALAQLGEHPWRGARPVVVPVLLVHGPRPPAYLLDAASPRGADQRSAFATAAEEFGMVVRFPTAADLVAWNVSAGQLPATPAGRSPDEMVVVGTLDWHESLPGWVGRWRTSWHGTKYAWGVRGVNYDAAFRDIVAGALRLASGHGSPD